jgi:uncharacterized membrane protein
MNSNIEADKDDNKKKIQKKAVRKQPSSEAIPEEIRDFLNKLPEAKRFEIMQAYAAKLSIIEKSIIFSGPLPPAAILKEYNEIIPNGAERIMKMAEKQSDHRIDIEKHAIKEQFKQSGIGQKFGFIISILGLVLASLLAYFGHDIIAGIFGTTTILGLVTVFVIGKKRQKSELKEKDVD